MAERENKCAPNLTELWKTAQEGNRGRAIHLKRHRGTKSFFTWKLKKIKLQRVEDFLWEMCLSNTAESGGARRQQRALRATAAPETCCIHSPLCHTKISLFNIQADLQIAFLYESLSLWLRPLNTFIRAKNSFANETPEKCSPAPQRDRMPSHCSRSMGAAGIVGTAWPCSSRSTQSRSCLIQGLSPSMFLRSETSDNTKLPWQ